ncbi:hypothetical protein DERF_005977 [Dermatophagoides farinae]|uniref:Uncharacterized protein n=1 Tax=Dermatophagoides farinae TaxID=6954 RepID=A0A922L770_DERFA|nr:hypothetical protein DERF_005977 [Dermatophagoides farinae]
MLIKSKNGWNKDEKNCQDSCRCFPLFILQFHFNNYHLYDYGQDGFEVTGCLCMSTFDRKKNHDRLLTCCCRNCYCRMSLASAPNFHTKDILNIQKKKQNDCLCLSEINWLKFSKKNYLQVTHDDAIP